METYRAGEKVTVTDAYRTNYPNWNIFGKEGTVVSARVKKLNPKSLTKEVNQMFQMRYGIRPEYKLFEIIVEVEGVKYLVSQFGFVKTPDDKE
jgi:hypothetical protein